jgi:hypothetical protein
MSKRIGIATGLAICALGASPALAAESFDVGGATHDREHGTARLVVRVDQPGRIAVGGNGAKPAAVEAGAAGKFYVPIRARGRALKKLEQTGKATVRPTITFTPTEGTPESEDVAVGLKLRLD